MSTVVYADPSPTGLAAMLGGLIEQNLARDPDRGRLLRPAVFVIEAPDADVAVTIAVTADGVRVADGADIRPDVRIAADSRRLLAVAGAPLRFGLPDVLQPAGRAVLVDILSRRVRISGLLRHPIAVAHFTGLLSAR